MRSTRQCLEKFRYQAEGKDHGYSQVRSSLIACFCNVLGELAIAGEIAKQLMKPVRRKFQPKRLENLFNVLLVNLNRIICGASSECITMRELVCRCRRCERGV